MFKLSKKGIAIRLIYLAVFAVCAFIMQNSNSIYCFFNSYKTTVNGLEIKYPYTTVNHLLRAGFVPVAEDEMHITRNPNIQRVNMPLSYASALSPTKYPGVPDVITLKKGGLKVGVSVWNYTTRKKKYLDCPIYQYTFYVGESLDELEIDGKNFSRFTTLDEVKRIMEGFEAIDYSPDNIRRIRDEDVKYLYSYEEPDYKSKNYYYFFMPQSKEHTLAMSFNETERLRCITIGRPTEFGDTLKEYLFDGWAIDDIISQVMIVIALLCVLELVLGPLPMRRGWEDIS